MARLPSDSLTAVLAGAAVYVQLLPSLSDVRRSDGNSATARDVHVGLVMGAALLVGIGAIVAADEGNLRPVWLTGGAAAVLTLVYLTTLRQAGEGDVLPTMTPRGPSAGRWSWT